MPPRRPYLAYGSNLHPARLRARLGPIEVLGAAVLEGRRLSFDKLGTDASGKCTVHPDPAGTLHGALFVLTPAQRATLDGIEGVGAGYTVERVTVDQAGATLEAFTYVAQATHLRPGLAPFGWYRGLVEAGTVFHGFPADYLEAIRAVATVEDPDARRRRRNAALLRSWR